VDVEKGHRGVFITTISGLTGIREEFSRDHCEVSHRTACELFSVVCRSWWSQNPNSMPPSHLTSPNHTVSYLSLFAPAIGLLLPLRFVLSALRCTALWFIFISTAPFRSTASCTRSTYDRTAHSQSWLSPQLDISRYRPARLRVMFFYLSCLPWVDCCTAQHQTIKPSGCAVWMYLSVQCQRRQWLACLGSELRSVLGWVHRASLQKCVDHDVCQVVWNAWVRFLWIDWPQPCSKRTTGVFFGWLPLKWR